MKVLNERKYSGNLVAERKIRHSLVIMCVMLIDGFNIALAFFSARGPSSNFNFLLRVAISRIFPASPFYWRIYRSLYQQVHNAAPITWIIYHCREKFYNGVASIM